MVSPWLPNLQGRQPLAVGKGIVEEGEPLAWPPLSLKYRREPIETYDHGRQVDEQGEADCESLAFRYASALRTKGIPCRLVRKRVGRKTNHWYLQILYRGRWRYFDPSVTHGMKPLKPEKYPAKKAEKIMIQGLFGADSVNVGETTDAGEPKKKAVNPLESESYNQIVGGVATAAGTAGGNPAIAAGITALGGAIKGVAGLITDDKNRKLANRQAKKAKKIAKAKGKAYKAIPVPPPPPKTKAYDRDPSELARVLQLKGQDASEAQVEVAQDAWAIYLKATKGDAESQRILGQALVISPEKADELDYALRLVVLSDPQLGMATGTDCCHACALGEQQAQKSPNKRRAMAAAYARGRRPPSKYRGPSKSDTYCPGGNCKS